MTTGIKTAKRQAQVSNRASVQELLKLTLTEDNDVKALITALPKGLKVIVDEDYTVYTVLPQSGTSESFALDKFRNNVSKLTKKKVPIRLVDTVDWQTYTLKIAKRNSVESSIEKDQRVDELINDAIAAGASDIHIRCGSDTAEILFRINQHLRPYKQGLTSDLVEQMVRAMWNNLKEKRDVGGSDWNAKQIQDTSFPFVSNIKGPDGKMERSHYMLRGNCTPEKRGFISVLRLRNTKELLPIESMGFTEQQVKSIIEISEMKQGLSLFTGPTNSGKSTILTTIMSKVDPKYAVIEVADPIEITLANVSHLEVNNEDETQMEKILKACVRLDPDYLIVGEIRSESTIKACTTMAFAGTSVMSTLHTNSAPASIPRMLELGLNQSTAKLKGFLNGVVSQNLIPVLCECSKKIVTGAMPEDVRKAQSLHYHRLFGGQARYVNPHGCSKCNGTGYTRITLIAEVLQMNDETRKIVATQNYDQLTDYMIGNDIPTKHRHAAQGVLNQYFDPRDIEQRVDKFNKNNIGNLGTLNA